jgi:hypothetical protein
MSEVVNEEEEGIVLPLVPWVFDPANIGNLSGVLLIPRVSNFRVPIAEFRAAIDRVDATHNTKFLDFVPHVIADDEAFSRTCQHFRHGGGTLLRVPQAANRNPRYTWAATVVDAATEMVSMEGRAWLEFRRDAKNKTVGTVHFSGPQDGYVMPTDVATEFDAAYNRNKLTFGTADCRTMVAAMLGQLSAKLIGRNIWFIPATSKLAVFADVMNAVNNMAQHSALVVFEIAKTTQNDAVAQQVITEVFKRQIAEAQQAVTDYIEDVKAYSIDPKNNKMRYKSRATRGFNDINVLVAETQLYASIMGEVAADAAAQAAELQQKWHVLYSTALVRDNNFDGASTVLALRNLLKPD